MFPSTSNSLQIWKKLSSLSSCSIRLQWIPEHLFLQRNDMADELARQRVLLVSSAIPGNLSFIFCTHSFFLDYRHTVTSIFFGTQVPSISPEELVLPCHARYVFSRLCCNGHSLRLSSCLYKTGRIENFSCSACKHPSQDTSHLILHGPATECLCHSLFGDTLVQAMGSCPTFETPWSSAMPPSLVGVR